MHEYVLLLCVCVCVEWAGCVLCGGSGEGVHVWRYITRTQHKCNLDIFNSSTMHANDIIIATSEKF